MNKLLKAVLIAALLGLQGCMTYWANPGGRNWDTDLRTCTAQSTKNVCRTTNQVSNSVCKTFPMDRLTVRRSQPHLKRYVPQKKAHNKKKPAYRELVGVKQTSRVR